MRLSLRRGFGVVTGAWSAPRRRPATALLVARLISALTTLLVLAYVSRDRGIEALGIASLGVVVGTLLAALAEGGTNSLATREISRSPTDGATLLSAIVVLRAVMFLLVVVVSIPLFRALFGATGDVILMFAMAFVVQQLAELPRAVLLATDRPYLLSAHYSVENLAWASAVIIVLAMGADLILAALAGTVVMTISVVISAGLALAYGVRPGRVTRAAFRKAIVLGFPFAAGSLVTVAALRL
ncbi:MAG: oligosaccharide flippase family protein, partial [Chloroflexi bacterium]|nr:oligosaccharide flippase family protein [Chloroflexota bacterium]